VSLAIQLYNYSKKFHPKTQIMASGLRTKDGEWGRWWVGKAGAATCLALGVSSSASAVGKGVLHLAEVQVYVLCGTRNGVF
jgi:hypothetical protein